MRYDTKRQLIPDADDAETQVRDAAPSDRLWVREQLEEHWGSVEISSLGVWHRADELPALIAWRGETRLGLVTFTPPRAGQDCEVITLSSAVENSGVGGLLLHAAAERARSAGSRRVFLTTTNDNLRAIGFYQRRGWSMVAVHPGAMDRARAVKPTIPLMGMNNIPLHDEIEFELRLT